jgi:hypothetical protein
MLHNHRLLKLLNLENSPNAPDELAAELYCG